MPTRIRPCRLGPEGEWMVLAMLRKSGRPTTGCRQDGSAVRGNVNLRRMWKVMTSLSQRSEHILLNLEV